MKKAVKKSARKATKTAASDVSAKRGKQVAAPTESASTRAEQKAARRGRASQRMAHVAERMGTTDLAALAAAMAAVLKRESAPTEEAVHSDSALLAFPNSNDNRWVSIGPSVVRRGQANGRPRVTGRIRDIAVDGTGRRAYAASGKAGVWYTEDAGASWRPVGGWQSTPASRGGISTDMSCGCLLVTFGATAADDYVMVGTGEIAVDTVSGAPSVAVLDPGGRGVLSGRGPATRTPSQTTFEAGSGIDVLENTAIYRLARDPSRTAPAQIAVTGDRVLAATKDGLFIGRCTTVSSTPSWVWTKLAGLDAFRENPPAFLRKLTDVQWVPVVGSANGRIIVVIDSLGVAWSDTLGAAGSWTWVTGINFAVSGSLLSTNLVLSAPVNGQMYVLSGAMRVAAVGQRDNNAQLHRIPDVARPAAGGGPGSAVLINGTPPELWGLQIHWDQALFTERIGGTDRVWLGGSGLTPYRGADFSAALYCYDVIDVGAGSPLLQPVSGVSDIAGAGADVAGLVGNGVHADVHAVTVVTVAAGVRHVWVSCDGGVYVSELGGRVNTFQSRVTGLAVIEAGFMAMHPTSSHYCALGAQDNGVQTRAGDTMWEMVQLGDGGGVVFHPVASQYIVSQFTSGSWFSTPAAGFVGPIDRAVGGANNTGDRESDISMFYSGCDTIVSTPGRARVAIGTERVWLTDDLGVAFPNSWQVLPFNTAAATAAMDPRPGSSDAANQTFGLQQPVSLGAVAQLRWASATRLYAVYQSGIVRHDQRADGLWTTALILGPAQADAPDTRTVLCTDIAPIPGSDDFYFTTLGDTQPARANATDTCWLFIGNAFIRTGLRHKLAEALPPGTLGPLDPGHSVCLDPDDDRVVFVGTIGGVFRGVRDAANAHEWTTFMNGLPSTCVSDLKVWKDPNPPAAGTPLKLLRAATQSRGVWEVDLVNPSPPSTYLRVHLRDDRRRLPTPMANPRRRPGVDTVPHASPDIVIRPAARAAASALVPFPVAAARTLGPADSGSYHLWTFQTAFRWHYPAIRADGLWTDQFADLIALFRSTRPALGTGNTIDQATWNAVVHDTRLSVARAVTLPASGNRCAVYETPWQLSGTVGTLATEVDIHELVQPLSVRSDIWRVYREPCTVDVLLHHRGTEARAANAAYTALYWRAAVTPAELLDLPASRFAPLHEWNGDVAVPAVPGFETALAGTNSVHQLPVPLDVFMPRAISIDVDLGTVTRGHHVMLVAICGSDAEAAPAPAGLAGSSRMADLVRAWPRAAMRIVQVTRSRPVPPPP